MSKNYMLSNAEMKLLEEFRKADAEYQAAQKVVTDLPSDHPAMDAALDAWNRASAARHTKATVFAMCVSASVGEVKS